MLKLQYKDGSRSIWLVGPKMRVGQSRDNDLVLSGAGISDVHAEFRIETDKLTIEPLGDSPCKVNGELLTGARRLNLGDELGIGIKEFVIIDPKKEGAQQSVASLRPAQKSAKQTDRPSAKQKNVGKGSAVDIGSGWLLQGDHKTLKNKRFPINGSVVVGRSPECDITFSYDRLSRKHAQFKEADGILQVKDMNSSNGTFLNDKKVTGTVRVRAGDTIAFDKLGFTVVGPDHAGDGVDSSSDEDLNKTVVRPALDIDALNQAAKESKKQKPNNSEAAIRAVVEEQAKVASRKNNNLLYLAIAALLLVGAGAFLLL